MTLLKLRGKAALILSLALLTVAFSSSTAWSASEDDMYSPWLPPEPAPAPRPAPRKDSQQRPAPQVTQQSTPSVESLGTAQLRSAVRSSVANRSGADRRKQPKGKSHTEARPRVNPLPAPALAPKPNSSANSSLGAGGALAIIIAVAGASLLARPQRSP